VAISRSTCVVVVLGIAVLCAGNARAANVDRLVVGTVTAVNDSPFAGGTPTQGIAVSDQIVGTLTYDNASGVASGSFTSFRLRKLKLTVPDTTQTGDSFDLIPVRLNSATRIVFDGAVFQGLVLPNNVTEFEDLAAFGLTGVDFESSGFVGPGFKFNLGPPVVEGTFAISPVPPVPTPAPVLGPVSIALFVVGLGVSGIWAARRAA